MYASSNLLDNHPFEVTRAYNTYHEDFQDSLVMPYRTFTHIKNYGLVKQLEKNGFFSDVFNNKFSAVVTVNNFSLSLRIGEKLNAVHYPSLSTANKTILLGHTPLYSIAKSPKEPSTTSNSWISSITTFRKITTTNAAMSFHHFA